MALTKYQEKEKRYFQIHLFNDDFFEDKHNPKNNDQISHFNLSLNDLKMCLKELKHKNSYIYI